MIVLLIALSLFNAAVGVASLAMGMRLAMPEEQALWRSKRALAVAEILCWGLPLIAGIATLWAWHDFLLHKLGAALFVLAPLAWIIVMGLVFAIVDYAEDGILGNARSNTPDRQ